MEAQTGSIYGLIDPRDGALRYVGQTIQRITERLQGHLHDYKQPTRKGRWIAELKSLSIKPQIVLLTQCVRVDLDDEEIGFIASMRAVGADLFNIADGGGGAGVAAETDDGLDDDAPRPLKRRPAVGAGSADVWLELCPSPPADDPYDDGFPPTDQWTEQDEKQWHEQAISQVEEWDGGRWDLPRRNDTLQEHKYAMRETE